MTNLFVLPALFAGLTLIVAVWSIVYKMDVKPPNKLSYKQPVLAFEFAITAQEIRTLFVDRNQLPAINFIQKMRYLTRLDFLFILSYTLFTTVFIWEIRMLFPTIFTHSALVISPLVGLFDVLENIQMLRILSKVESHPTDYFQPELHRLSIMTWVKWEATSVLLVLITPFLWKGGYLSNVMAVLSVVVFILGVLALVKRLSGTSSTFYVQFFASIILFSFLFFAIYTILLSIIGVDTFWL